MNECRFLANCKVWAKLHSGIKDVWIRNYCQGKLQDKCARKTLFHGRKPVADTLLPNGTSLPEVRKETPLPGNPDVTETRAVAAEPLLDEAIELIRETINEYSDEIEKLKQR